MLHRLILGFLHDIAPLSSKESALGFDRRDRVIISCRLSGESEMLRSYKRLFVVAGSFGYEVEGSGLRSNVRRREAFACSFSSGVRGRSSATCRLDLFPSALSRRVSMHPVGFVG